MMRKRLNAEELDRMHDHEFARIDSVVSVGVREFLASAVNRRPATLGETVRRWDAIVERQIRPELGETWGEVYTAATSGDTIVAAGRYSFEGYLAEATDRLSRRIKPGLPEAAWEAIKRVLGLASTMQLSSSQLAERIAQELSWSPSRDYWRQQESAVDAAIDTLLDRYGPPGSPAREIARQFDAAVSALQAEKARITRTLDREASYWQTRAQTIARTETAGMLNNANLAALRDEGWRRKEWLAAGGERTRPSHAAASGQVVGIDESFIVGGSAMQAPGDPGAPAAEVVNCRCSVVAAD